MTNYTDTEEGKRTKDAVQNGVDGSSVSTDTSNIETNTSDTASNTSEIASRTSVIDPYHDYTQNEDTYTVTNTFTLDSGDTAVFEFGLGTPALIVPEPNVSAEGSVQVTAVENPTIDTSNSTSLGFNNAVMNSDSAPSSSSNFEKNLSFSGGTGFWQKRYGGVGGSDVPTIEIKNGQLVVEVENTSGGSNDVSVTFIFHEK